MSLGGMIATVFDIPGRIRKRRAMRSLARLTADQRADLGLPAPVEDQLFDRQARLRLMYLGSMR